MRTLTGCPTVGAVNRHGTRLRHAAGYAACVAGLAAIASGCAGSSPRHASSSASASLTVSASPSPTRSASPSASPSYSVPPAARAKTVDGAVAFVRFYIDQLNKAWMKPDPTLLPPLGESGCKSCDGFETTARGLFQDGLHYDTTPVTITSLLPRTGSAPPKIWIDAEFRQNRANEINREGVVSTPQPAKDLSRVVVVIWQEEKWLLYDMGA